MFLPEVPAVMRTQLYHARMQRIQHAPKQGQTLPTFNTYLDTEQSSRDTENKHNENSQTRTADRRNASQRWNYP